MTDHTDIVERLNNTPNWMREAERRIRDRAPPSAARGGSGGAA